MNCSILSAFFLFFSCTKSMPSGYSISNKIVGVWLVKNQVSGAWPYPWPVSWPAYDYALSYPESLQFDYFTNDSFNVKFGNDGTYSYTRPTGGYSYPAPGLILYTPYHVIQASGSYHVLNDEEILIGPDSSELLKFCFNSASNYISLLPSDTIHLEYNLSDSLTVLQRWIAPNEYETGVPNCIYQTYTLFKKAE